VPAVTPGAQPQDIAGGVDTIIRNLYLRFGRQIYSFSYGKLGSREEAEDATQATFLNALHALKRGVVVDYESAWLFKIARNVCVNSRRSSSRRLRFETADNAEGLEYVAHTGTPGRHELLGLTDAVRALPKTQRQAFLLREWQGLAYKEIAAELGVSDAAVEMLLFRARRSLSQTLTERTSRRQDTRLGLLGWLFGSSKELLVGGAKTAATLTTAVATSVAVATPVIRHDLERALSWASHAGPAGAQATRVWPLRDLQAAEGVNLVSAKAPAAKRRAVSITVAAGRAAGEDWTRRLSLPATAERGDRAGAEASAGRAGAGATAVGPVVNPTSSAPAGETPVLVEASPPVLSAPIGAGTNSSQEASGHRAGAHASSGGGGDPDVTPKPSLGPGSTPADDGGSATGAPPPARKNLGAESSGNSGGTGPSQAGHETPATPGNDVQSADESDEPGPPDAGALPAESNSGSDSVDAAGTGGKSAKGEKDRKGSKETAGH
jgi:RNA polymerase sigma-70 factor, ECF subfamily